MKAVTDTQKSAVRFEIDGVGTYDTTSYDSESQGDNNVRIFSASATISTPGTYTVRAYSSSGGGYSSDYREVHHSRRLYNGFRYDNRREPPRK